MSQYTNDSQQRVFAAVEALSRRLFDGLTADELTELLDTPRDQVYRTLRNLGEAGWAEQGPGGRWRLTPKMTALAERVRIAIADLHRTYLGEGGA